MSDPDRKSYSARAYALLTSDEAPSRIIGAWMIAARAIAAAVIIALVIGGALVISVLAGAFR